MQKYHTDRAAVAHALESFPRQYAGYIFDLDGTLADSMPVHFHAWRQAFADNGAKFEFTWELFYQHAGVGGHDTILALEKRFGQALEAEPILQLQHDLLMEGLPEVEPIERAVAKELQGQGQSIAVASGGERDHVLDTLRVIDLENFFPIVVTKDDVANSKPHPETFLLAAQRMGIPPQHCLVFEDSLLGVRAAQAAGMDYVYLEPDMQRF